MADICRPQGAKKNLKQASEVVTIPVHACRAQKRETCRVRAAHVQPQGKQTTTLPPSMGAWTPTAGQSQQKDTYLTTRRAHTPYNVRCTTRARKGKP